MALADPFAAIEAKVGGRLGVAALDVASGARLGYRADERFPMCSTFKVFAVAALLKQVDLHQDRLDRMVPYGLSDLALYSPVTEPRSGQGVMSLAELCQAAIEFSDNTAANLILKCIGGPAAVTRFARSLGDTITRLDRTEPTLNTAIPGDARDTTSPSSVLADLRLLCLDQGAGALTPASQTLLTRWMADCKTGGARLRAGLPSAWRVGDKTGTGDNGTANDIAVARTSRGPVIITAYLTGALTASSDARSQALADVGRSIAAVFEHQVANG